MINMSEKEKINKRIADVFMYLNACFTGVYRELSEKTVYSIIKLFGSIKPEVSIIEINEYEKYWVRNPSSHPTPINAKHWILQNRIRIQQKKNISSNKEITSPPKWFRKPFEEVMNSLRMGNIK